MEDGRQYLGSGSRLTLGNTEYRIINAVGSGSNAIVYKAVYQDGVEKQYCHYVLIKELFPGTRTEAYTETVTGAFAAGRSRKNISGCMKEVSGQEMRSI